MTLITELTDERIEKNYFVRDVILMRDSLRVALTKKAELRSELARKTAECTAFFDDGVTKGARIRELEDGLRHKDIDLAEAMALVYSHEGAIHRVTGAHEESVKQVEALENRLAASEAQLCRAKEAVRKYDVLTGSSIDEAWFALTRTGPCPHEARCKELEGMVLWAVMEFRVWGMPMEAQKLLNWCELRENVKKDAEVKG